MSFKTPLLSHQSITGLIFSFSGSLGVIILLQVCADGIGTVLTENAFHLDSLTYFLRERCWELSQSEGNQKTTLGKRFTLNYRDGNHNLNWNNRGLSCAKLSQQSISFWGPMELFLLFELLMVELLICWIVELLQCCIVKLLNCWIVDCWIVQLLLCWSVEVVQC